jgi:hypothetical protein
VPRRGPEAGDLRIQYDFYGLDVIRIDSYLFLQSHSPDPISKFYTLRAGTGCPALGGDNECLFFIKEPEPLTGACHHPFRCVVHLAQVCKDDLRHVFSQRLQAPGSSGVGQVPSF